jgi:hypothetical protein
LREDREKRNQGAVLKRNQWTTKNWPVAVLTQESQKKNQFETKKKTCTGSDLHGETKQKPNRGQQLLCARINDRRKILTEQRLLRPDRKMKFEEQIT